jgi:hypothetical protein
VYVDLVVVPNIDLSVARAIVSTVAMGTLLLGLISETHS